MLFDLLYHRCRRLLHEPLARRRQALADACAELRVPDVTFSAGAVGLGKACCAEAVARGQGGVRVELSFGEVSPIWGRLPPDERDQLLAVAKV